MTHACSGHRQSERGRRQDDDRRQPGPRFGPQAARQRPRQPSPKGRGGSRRPFFEPRQILARQVYQDLVDKYGRSRVAIPIIQSVVVQQAQAAGGQTLFEYAPAETSPATAAYQRLVDRLYAE